MKKLLLLPLLLLVFMACDLDKIVEEIEDSITNFDATVTGDVSTSFTGGAEFVNASVESQTPMASNLVVYLENENDPDEIITLNIILADVTGGVPAGTYEYDINNEDVLVTGNYSTADALFFVPDPTKTNEIILSKVENTSVEGSFNLTVTDVLGGSVTISGTFKAIGITETI